MYKIVCIYINMSQPLKDCLVHLSVFEGKFLFVELKFLFKLKICSLKNCSFKICADIEGRSYCVGQSIALQNI